MAQEQAVQARETEGEEQGARSSVHVSSSPEPRSVSD